MEHGDDHPGPGESVPQGDSPKGPYIKYVTGKHQEVWTGNVTPQSCSTVGESLP